MVTREDGAGSTLRQARGPNRRASAEFGFGYHRETMTSG
jgi:hypothetical protein